jgi:hypothetical protein
MFAGCKPEAAVLRSRLFPSCRRPNSYPTNIHPHCASFDPESAGNRVVEVTVADHVDGPLVERSTAGLGLVVGRWVTAHKWAGQPKRSAEFLARCFDIRLVRQLTSWDDGVTLRSIRLTRPRLLWPSWPHRMRPKIWGNRGPATCTTRRRGSWGVEAAAVAWSPSSPTGVFLGTVQSRRGARRNREIDK